MLIYLVRHGETQWNKEEVFRGRKDVPLNETGRKQAKQAGVHFAGVPVRRIVLSPRCKGCGNGEGHRRDHRRGRRAGRGVH